MTGWAHSRSERFGEEKKLLSNGGIEPRFLDRPARSKSSPTIPTKLLASNHFTVITFSKRQTQISIKSWAVTPKSTQMNPNNFVKYAIKLETWICRYARLVKVTFCGPQGVKFYTSTCVRVWKNSVSLWHAERLGWHNYGPTVCTSTGPSTCSSRATCPWRHEKTSFNPFPGKATTERRSNFENLWAPGLWRQTLHYYFIL